MATGDPTLSSSPYEDSRLRNEAEHDRIVFTPDSSRNDCERCGRLFNLVRRKHHCRNCGGLVCGDCSKARWPSAMLRYNPRNEKWVRVCRQCHQTMENFRTALLEGNFRTALQLFEQSHGALELHRPYLMYRQKMYPIHCAAAGGSVECLSWLVSLGCDTQSRDAAGWTPLTHAADNDHLSLMRWLIIAKQSSVSEITDPSTLQRALHNAIVLLPAAGIPVIHSPRRTSYSHQDAASLVNESTIPIENSNGQSGSQSITSSSRRNMNGSSEADIEIGSPSRSDMQLLVANMNQSSAESALVSQVSELEVQDSHQTNTENTDDRREIVRVPSRSSVDVSEEEQDESQTSVAASALPPQFLNRLTSNPKKTGSTGSFASAADSLNESDECIVCFANPVDSVLVPCGHFCCCHACASEFFECPICRMPVEQVVKTFKT